MRRALAEMAKRATPTLHVPARFEEHARLDRLDWIAKKSPVGRRALEHCRRFAEDPKGVKGPLLMGSSGTGKTHLLFGMARRIEERMLEQIEATKAEHARTIETVIGRYHRPWNERDPRPSGEWHPAFPVLRLAVTAGAEIAHDLRSSIDHKNLDAVVARLKQLARGDRWGLPPTEETPPPGAILVLLVDDIEVSKLSDWLHEELYRIFDFRYAENLPTAIASNLAPGELQAHLGDRITRRLFEMTEPFELA